MPFTEPDASVSRCRLDGTWVWADQPCTTCGTTADLEEYAP